MAYFSLDDSPTSSDDFLARLEAKINSIGVSTTPSPTNEESVDKNNYDNERNGTFGNVIPVDTSLPLNSPGLKSPASVGTLLNDDLSLDGIPGFQEDNINNSTCSSNNNNNQKKKKKMSQNSENIEDDNNNTSEDLTFLLTPELRKTSRKTILGKSNNRKNIRSTLSKIEDQPVKENNTLSIANHDDTAKLKKTPKLIDENKKKQLHVEDCFDTDSIYHPQYLSNFLTGKIKYIENENDNNSRAIVSPVHKESWPTIFNGSGVKKRYERLHKHDHHNKIHSNNNKHKYTRVRKNELDATPLRLSDAILDEDGNMDVHTPQKIRNNYNKYQRQQQQHTKLDAFKNNVNSIAKNRRDKVNPITEHKRQQYQKNCNDGIVVHAGDDDTNNNENVTIHVRSRNIENSNGHKTVKKTIIATNSRQKKSLSNNHRRPRGNNISLTNRVDNNSFKKGKKQQQKVGFSPFTTPKPKKRFVHTPSPSFQRKGHTYLKKGSSTKQKLQPKVRRSSWKEKLLQRHDNIDGDRKQLNEAEKSIARTSKYMENIATQYSASRMYIRAPVSKFRASRSGRASTGSTADDDVL
jgi:hypothetical protein